MTDNSDTEPSDASHADRETTPVPVVAIDGPSGSGKGTLAARVAASLGWWLLDSGALYRIVAACALRDSVALDDEAALARLAADADVAFDDGRVVVGGDDFTDEIRREDVGHAASVVAAVPAVRDAVFGLQQSFRRPPGLVADGRDMGTVVFPDAFVKIYLDASAEVRAERRYNQLKNKGLSVNFRDLLDGIRQRDARDLERTVSPLKPAHDAIVLDSSQMSIEEVVAHVQGIVSERLARLDG